MLDIIICDDNPIHNQFLLATTEKMIFRHNLNGRIVLSTGHFEQVLNHNPSPDHTSLYLLDVHLGEAAPTGIDVAAQIRERDKTAYIVFVTAHQQYSLIGYKTKTFDFLLKPLNEEIVEQMLLRVFGDMEAAEPESNVLRLKVGSVYHSIPYATIVCFEKMRNILYIHTADNVYSAYESLKTISQQIPEDFVACHKSYIVARNKIRAFDSANQTLTLTNGKICPVSRRYKGSLAQLFEPS